MAFNRQLIFTFILLSAAGFLVWLLIKGFPQRVEINKQLSDINSQIDNLKKEEERQKNLLEYITTEGYIEKQARIRLNFKKEGEEVVFIYNKEKEEEEIQERPKENPFLSKLKELFRFLID